MNRELNKAVAGKTPFDQLAEQVQNDPEYAWGWQCNIAMPIFDEGGANHEQANRAAARAMSVIFDVDITALDHWKDFEKQWRQNG